jgi:alpha-amylase
MIEGENYAGFPHLCHRNPVVYTELFNYARVLIEELGFDGFRFNFVKGFGAWMIGMLSKYRYVKDGAEFSPWVVGEYWSGQADIDAWMKRSTAIQTIKFRRSTFRFVINLRKSANEPNYDLRNLTYGESVVMKRPAHAATFVDNHDMAEDMIVNDKLMAYSFIMIHEGYPSIFWFDYYYNNGLARPFTPKRHRRADAGAAQICWRRLPDTPLRSRSVHHPAGRIQERHGRSARIGICPQQPWRQVVQLFGEDPVGEPEIHSDCLGWP